MTEIKFRGSSLTIWKHRNDPLGTKKISLELFTTVFENPKEISRHYTFFGAKLKKFFLCILIRISVKVLKHSKILYRSDIE